MTPCFEQFPQRGWTSSHYTTRRWIASVSCISGHRRYWPGVPRRKDMGACPFPFRSNFFFINLFFLTLILRFLHRRHPARDFLCDLLGGIRRVPDSLVRLQSACSDDSRCATHWWHRHAGRGKGAFLVMLQAICRGLSRNPTVGSESVERCNYAASSDVERPELECLCQEMASDRSNLQYGFDTNKEPFGD